MSGMQQRYQILFENMAEGAYYQEADGSLADVNQSALEMFGLSRDQFLGRTSYHPEWRVINGDGTSLLPEEHPSMVALRTGQQVRGFVAGVFNPLRQDIVWLEITAIPMFKVEEATPYEVFVTLHDITAQKIAELELAASQNRYQAIVNTQLEFVDRYLPGGILTFVNDSLCRYVGVPPEDLLGKSFYPFIHDGDREVMLRAIESLCPQNPCVALVNRVVLPNGTIHWHNWTHHGLFDHDGNIVEYQSVGRDVTEQQQMVESLRQSEEKYRALINTTGTGYVILDVAGRVLDANSEYVRLSGHETLQQILGRAVTEWTADHDLERNAAEVTKCIEQGFVQNLEIDYLGRNGERVPLEINAKAITTPEGLRIVTLCRDISERKQMVTALRESEEKYRRFIATANEGIIIADGDFIITYVNDSLAQMLGYEPADLIGIPVSRLIAADELVEFPAKMDERRQGIRSQRECRHRRKDGSLVWLLTSSSPIMDDEGIFHGCFAMFTDLTYRKEAEEALLQVNDKLEARVAERTAALAEANEKLKKISFELVLTEERERTRIAGELHDQVGQSLLLAKMKLDMLADTAAQGSKRESAEEISSLIENSIQDIRSLTFRMRPPMLDTTGIETALEWLCTSVEADYGLQVDFSGDHRPKPLAREGRYSLYLAVRELLLNVVKHAESSRAQLSIETDFPNLVVHVKDNGAGFDQGAEDTNLALSRGFGLFNVRHRIEQMGGRFAIESAAGKGTHAAITVPLAEN